MTLNDLKCWSTVDHKDLHYFTRRKNGRQWGVRLAASWSYMSVSLLNRTDNIPNTSRRSGFWKPLDLQDQERDFSKKKSALHQKPHQMSSLIKAAAYFSCPTASALHFASYRQTCVDCPDSVPCFFPEAEQGFWCNGRLEGDGEAGRVH